MPAKLRKHDEFLLAAYDALGDVSLNYDVKVGFSLLPSKRRGIFDIRLRAMRAVPNDKLREVASYTISYPNAAQQELTAALFAAVNKLDHLLAERERNDLEGPAAGQ